MFACNLEESRLQSHTNSCCIPGQYPNCLQFITTHSFNGHAKVCSRECLCFSFRGPFFPPPPHSDLKPFTSRLADYLVLAKVRQALGFAKCQKNFYGAAPMTAETQRFFLGLNIRLYAGYGLSESTGPHFMSSPYNYRLYR